MSCASLQQSFTKFCWAVSEELRWQTVLSSIFHFGQISMLKKGVILRRKNTWIKFPVDMRINTLYPSLLQSFTKFCWAVSEELSRQEKQDWLTDGSKTLYTPQLVAWGIKRRDYQNWKVHDPRVVVLVLERGYMMKMWIISLKKIMFSILYGKR